MCSLMRLKLGTALEPERSIDILDADSRGPFHAMHFDMIQQVKFFRFMKMADNGSLFRNGNMEMQNSRAYSILRCTEADMAQKRRF